MCRVADVRAYWPGDDEVKSPVCSTCLWKHYGLRPPKARTVEDLHDGEGE